MATRLTWIAYYDDGAIYRSTETAWAALPDEGVQVVMLYHPDWPGTGREILMGLDDYLPLNETVAKRGRWMDDAAFEELLAQALAEE